MSSLEILCKNRNRPVSCFIRLNFLGVHHYLGMKKIFWSIPLVDIIGHGAYQTYPMSCRGFCSAESRLSIWVLRTSGSHHCGWCSWTEAFCNYLAEPFRGKCLGLVSPTYPSGEDVPTVASSPPPPPCRLIVAFELVRKSLKAEADGPTLIASLAVAMRLSRSL